MPRSRGLRLYIYIDIQFYQKTAVNHLLHRYDNGLPFNALCRKKSKTPFFIAQTSYRFRLFPVRSPLLRESYVYHRYPEPIGNSVIYNFDYFLFLWVLRCFTSPGSLRYAYKFSAGSPTFDGQRGSPIRTSPDQRLLATSPKLIAGCYVLHRLTVSRHPPCALVHYRST